MHLSCKEMLMYQNSLTRFRLSLIVRYLILVIAYLNCTNKGISTVIFNKTFFIYFNSFFSILKNYSIV